MKFKKLEQGSINSIETKISEEWEKMDILTQQQNLE